MSTLKKIMIVPFGEWLGHSAGPASYGPEDGQRMAARANALVESSGNPIVIDYEHASLKTQPEGAPAAGWMREFTVENDGVYAMVEWTPKAAERIKNGEYKYISPVICTGGKDPVTGETVDIELFNAALVNTPFMHDRMKQVVATAVEAQSGKSWYVNSKNIQIHSQKGGPKMGPDEIVGKVLAALGLPETATADDAIAILKKASEFMSLMPGAPAGEAMPKAPEMEDMMRAARRVIANSKTLDDVAALLKVDADKVLPTVAAMSNKTGSSDTLANELAEVKAKLHEREAADLVASYSKKIPPAKREFWHAYAKTNGIAAAKAVLDEMPDVLPGADPAKVTPKDKPVDADVLRFSRENGLTDDDIKKYSRKQEDK